MNCINYTPMVAACTVQTGVDGRLSVVVVVKATFNLPLDGSRPLLLPQQQPLLDADTFWGEPGLSAPRQEMDFAASKPYCDVLLSGSAHAPAGGTIQLPVGMRVGNWTKRFRVIGDRFWQTGLLGVRASPPEVFHVMPLDYGRAYGGSVQLDESPDSWSAYAANPVGRGHYVDMVRSTLDGRSLPNIEEWSSSITRPDEVHPPLSFGPIGRNWQPRVGYAGRYDDLWLEQRFPLLPDDFDHRYFQAAASDQWVQPLQGKEEIVLINLVDHAKAGGERVAFVMPELPLVIRVHPKRGASHLVKPVVDTLFIEPDEERFCVVWRVAHLLRQSPAELSVIEVGTPPFRGEPVLVPLEAFKAGLHTPRINS